jgi:mannose-6-phosphate isomerase-like protein (cupin superfamily)
VDAATGFKVKRLIVRPGARLSLQRHDLRAETWVVVAGIATCWVAGRSWVAGPGEVVQVPRMAAHRLANDQAQELVVVEVRVGVHTGEDDIVRLADDYGRVRGVA